MQPNCKARNRKREREANRGRRKREKDREQRAAISNDLCVRPIVSTPISLRCYALARARGSVYRQVKAVQGKATRDAAINIEVVGIFDGARVNYSAAI